MPPSDETDVALAAARMALEEVAERKYPCWPLDGRLSVGVVISAIRALRDGLE